MAIQTLQTAGDLRAAIAAQKLQWTVNPALADGAPLPTPSLGLIERPPAADPSKRIDVLGMVRSSPPTNVLLKNDMTARGVFGGAATGTPAPSASVDWRNRFGWPWLTAIRDQDPCEHCWIYASTALVEAMTRIEHCAWAPRSEGDYIEANKVPCSQGGNAAEALDWYAAHGSTDLDCVPWLDTSTPNLKKPPYWEQTSNVAPPAYEPSTLRSGRTVRIVAPTEVDHVVDQKAWLENVGPLTAAFTVYSDFYGWYGTKPYTVTSGAVAKGGHLVLIVGYDDALGCWIVRNSWGTGFGDNGYCLIAYGQADIDANVKYGLTMTNPDPWSKRRSHNGGMIESGNGPLHRNFELVAPSAGNSLTHWARNNAGSDWSWSKVNTLGNDVADPPALTATTYNRNFELVYRTTANRLHHRWFDQATQEWNDGATFGPSNASGCVGFIESSWGPGNLEVVVGIDDQQLQHWYRVGSTWQASATFGSNVSAAGGSLIQSTWGNLEMIALLHTGQMQHFWRDGNTWKGDQVFGSGIGSPPIMIQGQYGMADEHGNGNFELVVANASGTMEHWWRDSKTMAWAKSATFGSGIERVVALVESSYGFALEAVAITTAGTLQHFWRDGSGWHAGVVIGPAR